MELHKSNPHVTSPGLCAIAHLTNNNTKALEKLMHDGACTVVVSCLQDSYVLRYWNASQPHGLPLLPSISARNSDGGNGRCKHTIHSTKPIRTNAPLARQIDKWNLVTSKPHNQQIENVCEKIIDEVYDDLRRLDVNRGYETRACALSIDSNSFDTCLARKLATSSCMRLLVCTYIMLFEVETST